MNQFYQILFFCLLFSLLKDVRSDPADTEICKYVETVDSSNPQLISTAPQSITQPECVRFFKLDLSDPTYSGTSLLIEVIFQDYSQTAVNMMIVENYGSIPILYYNQGGIDIVGNYDLDAYYNRKTYHSLNLNKSTVARGGLDYIAIYKPFFNGPSNYVNVTVSYTIQIKTSTDNYICPNNNCNGQGTCDQILQQCVCLTGYFDTDCSVTAARLTAVAPVSQTIPAGKWRYFYVPLTGVNMNVKTEFAFSMGGLFFAFSANAYQNFQIPNSRQNDDYYRTSNSQTTANLLFYRSFFRSQQDGNLMIGVYNQRTSPITITGDITYIDDVSNNGSIITLFLIIMIAVAVAALTTCVLTMRYKRRQRWNRTQREIIVQMQLQGQPVGIEQQRPQNHFLSPEELQRFFPLKKYADLKTNFGQTSCSVCLDDYLSDTLCRQLYCEHIFHENCIQEWLKKHDSCPNCKSEMTKDAIKKFLRAKKKEEREARKKEAESKQTAPKEKEIISAGLSEDNLRAQQPDAENNSPLEAKNALEGSVYEGSQGDIEQGDDIAINFADIHPQIVNQQQGRHIDDENRRLETESAVDEREMEERRRANPIPVR